MLNKNQGNKFICTDGITSLIAVSVVLLLLPLVIILIKNDFEEAKLVLIAGLASIVILFIPLAFFRYRWYEITDEQINIKYLFNWNISKIFKKLSWRYPSEIKLKSIKKIDIRYSGDTGSFRWIVITLNDDKKNRLPVNSLENFRRFFTIVSGKMQKLGIIIPEIKGWVF
ncbi:MAG: hypothetical protein NT094_04810 [Candidatus Staskawiczbacteria bacterium]|nr:hypothetical protein [Candidatus Staskawiczbacteria bacterium]